MEFGRRVVGQRVAGDLDRVRGVINSRHVGAPPRAVQQQLAATVTDLQHSSPLRYGEHLELARLDDAELPLEELVVPLKVWAQKELAVVDLCRYPPEHGVPRSEKYGKSAAATRNDVTLV